MEKNWMVIGYSRLEGEYPVALNLTEAEAKALAEKNNLAVKEHTGKMPPRPDIARCMIGEDK